MAERSSVAETLKAGGSLFSDTSLAAESHLAENVIAAEASAWTNLPDNPIGIKVN